MEDPPRKLEDWPKLAGMNVLEGEKINKFLHPFPRKSLEEFPLLANKRAREKGGVPSHKARRKSSRGRSKSTNVDPIESPPLERITVMIMPILLGISTPISPDLCAPFLIYRTGVGCGQRGWYDPIFLLPAAIYPTLAQISEIADILFAVQTPTPSGPHPQDGIIVFFRGDGVGRLVSGSPFQSGTDGVIAREGPTKSGNDFSFQTPKCFSLEEDPDKVC